MADPRFFKKHAPLKLEEIAQKINADIHTSSEKHKSFLLKDLASLKEARSEDLSFLINKSYLEDFKTSQAGACIIDPQFIDYAPPHMFLLLTKTPYHAWALATQIFYPYTIPSASIAPTATIDPSATVGNNCYIEAGAVIQQNAIIGNECHICSNSVIGKGVILGSNCYIGPNASILYTKAGNNVRIHSGASIGQDGFGFDTSHGQAEKIMQIGRVIIEDNVEIGANTTIDRGAITDTVIKEGTQIDNLVQIAHNVHVGKQCILVSQVGVAGTSHLEDYVVLGGQAGVSGHLRIGTGAQIGAQAGVMRNISPKEIVIGTPAFPIKEFWRRVATLSKITKSRCKTWKHPESNNNE